MSVAELLQAVVASEAVSIVDLMLAMEVVNPLQGKPHSMIKSISNLFKSPSQVKFEKAREAKAKRLLIERDGKRNAVSHPTN